MARRYVTVVLRLDLDEEEWAAEYDVLPARVKADLKSYFDPVEIKATLNLGPGLFDPLSKIDRVRVIVADKTHLGKD